MGDRVEPQKRRRLNSKKHDVVTPNTYESPTPERPIYVDVASDNDVTSITHEAPKPEQPIYVDVASRKVYYLSAVLSPPVSNYVTRYQTNSQDNRADTWRVSVGDTVAVHGTESPRTGKDATNEYHPFVVPWIPGEIISMWEKVALNDAVKLSKQLGKSKSKSKAFSIAPSDDREVMVEIRWLYRSSEVPLAKVEAGLLEEVFETDHVDYVSAESLLSPIKLFDRNEMQSAHSLFDSRQIPIPRFCCYRFWSIYRRSLVPCGSALHRAERGMLCSTDITRDTDLKSATECALGWTNGKKQDETFSAAIGELPIDSSTLDSKKLLEKAASTFALTAADADSRNKGVNLKGREKEQQRITKFLRSAITSTDGRSYSSLFVAGPPGTGKTSTVKAVIAQLRHEQACGKIPEFNFFSINGLELKNPFDAYISLWESLSTSRGCRERCTAGEAANRLERYFGGDDTTENNETNEPIVLLLLDEIDYLVTEKQTVLYNFFDWPCRKGGGGLVVVGISNTINLPQRLQPRVQSRLGTERCIFHSYNINEIRTILKERLSFHGVKTGVVFSEDAIIFASRKTAGFSGDIRKAFQMCRAAAEVVIDEIECGTRRDGNIVGIKDVQKATKAMLDSPILSAVSTATHFEALLLISLASIKKQSGREQGGSSLRELLQKMKSVAESFGDIEYMPIPTFKELNEMCNRLTEVGLLNLTLPRLLHPRTISVTEQDSQGGVLPTIKSKVENSDLYIALRNSPHKNMAEKFLGVKLHLN